MHGHSFKAELQIAGPIDTKLGWVMDFAQIRHAFAPLHALLDHHVLNEVEGLENPTSENLALWILDRLGDTLPGLIGVVVHETCTARCQVLREPPANASSTPKKSH